MKINRFVRPAMQGIVIGGLITAVLWLNQPIHLPYFNQLEATAQAQSQDTEQTPTLREQPEVNSAAFKGQGKLAFISKGLLYVLDGSTSKVKQLTEFGSALEPTWSHDGEWLAFKLITDKSAMTGPLWLVRKDGTRAHQVQGLPGTVMTGKFDWSPASNLLAVSTEDGLWLVPTEGKPHRLIAKQGGYPTFSWSPDGKALAYNDTLPYKVYHAADDVLLTVDIKGGQPVKHLQTSGAGITLAGWQPDGKGLLYWVNPSRGASAATDGLELWSLQLAESKSSPLTTGLPNKEWQSFSPQGQLLTVEGSDRIVWANKSIAVVDPQTGRLQHIASPDGCVAIDPDFSPDGKNIAYVAAKNLGRDVWGFDKTDDLDAWVNSRALYIANADGSDARALPTAGQGIYQPAWSKDGRHILFIKDNALWSINIEGGNPEKIFEPVSEQKDQFGFYGFTSYQDTFSWFKG
ncbi:biopolymer transporter Tol [Desulfoscipio gibsoniae]